MRKIVLLALLALSMASVALAIPAPSISIDLAGDGSRNVSTWTYGGDYTAHFCPNATIAYPNGSYLSVLFVTNYSVSDGANEYLDADVSGTQLTKSYDPTKGRLTISGVDSVATYQQVLRSVYYVDSLANPTVGNRDIEAEAFYGNTGSNAPVCSLSVQRDPKAPTKSGLLTSRSPAMTANPTREQLGQILQPGQGLTPPHIDLSGGNGGPNYSTWTYGGPTFYGHICPNAIVSYSGELTSLAITLTNHPNGSSEYLAVQNYDLTGLSTEGYNPSTGQLIITGGMDSAVCQAVLRSIVYVELKTQPNCSDRIINVRVSSASLTSNVPTMTMGVATSPTRETTALIGSAPLQGRVPATSRLVSKTTKYLTAKSRSRGTQTTVNPGGPAQLAMGNFIQVPVWIIPTTGPRIHNVPAAQPWAVTAKGYTVTPNPTTTSTAILGTPGTGWNGTSPSNGAYYALSAVLGYDSTLDKTVFLEMRGYDVYPNVYKTFFGLPPAVSQPPPPRQPTITVGGGGVIGGWGVAWGAYVVPDPGSPYRQFRVVATSNRCIRSVNPPSPGW